MISKRRLFELTELIKREFQNVNAKIDKLILMAKTVEQETADLLTAVQQEETVEASLVALVNNLGTQIKNTVPGLTDAQQAAIDSIISSVNADSVTMANAVTANTPAGA